jgi:GNAT superfamily N-acetyltransferase
MTAIEVRAVSTRKERRSFLTFPWRVYAHDPLWVAPPLPDLQRRIDPERGPFFQRGGEAQFFIAWRGAEPVGTICAAEDRAANERRGARECMFGFFECVNDFAVAEALFRRAAQWAASRELRALWGPFNLDYEDSYGILIEGRDRPPVMLCGHTPTYYQGFVERYGFSPARGDNIAFEVPVADDTPPRQRLRRIAARLRGRGRFTIRGAKPDHFQEEVDNVYGLINRALAHLPDSIGWQRSALESTFRSFLQFADPDLILFAEAEGQVVGWFPGVPNVNEWFIHANGLRYPWDYLKLRWVSRRQPECLAVKSVLVLPEYWDTGVAVLLFDELDRRARAKGYRWADLSLTSVDNPRTPILAERMGARIYKRYRVYRKEIQGIVSSEQ